MKIDIKNVKEMAGKKVKPLLGYGLIAAAFVATLVIGLLCIL